MLQPCVYCLQTPHVAHPKTWNLGRHELKHFLASRCKATSPLPTQRPQRKLNSLHSVSHLLPVSVRCCQSFPTRMQCTIGGSSRSAQSTCRPLPTVTKVGCCDSLLRTVHAMVTIALFPGKADAEQHFKARFTCPPAPGMGDGTDCCTISQSRSSTHHQFMPQSSLGRVSSVC